MIRLWRRAQVEAERDELERAKRRLAEVRGQWPDVHLAAATMRAHKERNGFAAQIRAAMGVRDQ